MSDSLDPSLFLCVKAHNKPIRDIAFSPTGKLASASEDEDYSVRIWDISQNTRSLKFKGHSDIIMSVDYSKDGAYLASASKDCTVRLWIPTTKGGTTEMKAHKSAVNCVSFNSDNSKLVTASDDKSVKLWDASEKHLIMSYLGHNNSVKCVRTSPNEDMIVSCSDDHSVRVWSVKSGEEIYSFEGTRSSPTYLSLHQNNYSIAVAMNSGSVRVYDMRNRKLQQHYTLHDYTTCVSWHPTSSVHLLSSGKDGQLRIVNAMEGRPVYTLTMDNSPIFTAKFSFDGKYAACGGVDECIVVWQMNFI